MQLGEHGIDRERLAEGLLEELPLLRTPELVERGERLEEDRIERRLVGGHRSV